MNYKIRLATTEDAKSLSAIEQALFTGPRSEATFKSSIELDDNAVAIVAESNGAVIAYADVYKAYDELQLNNIAVLEQYRGNHIAEQMMQILADTGRELECQTITLEVRESNEPAIKLYEKCGFHRVGMRKNYYSDNENAILMDKEL
ncbi:MAG: ribosomal protein S18-alanine N-acetyltransferase [Clostridiales bacterium]|nr:ribosomal protein S18-alanine N-acetyltransferase [Candidatus Crickella equi]